MDDRVHDLYEYIVRHTESEVTIFFVAFAVLIIVIVGMVFVYLSRQAKRAEQRADAKDKAAAEERATREKAMAEERQQLQNVIDRNSRAIEKGTETDVAMQAVIGIISTDIKSGFTRIHERHDVTGKAVERTETKIDANTAALTEIASKVNKVWMISEKNNKE